MLLKHVSRVTLFLSLLISISATVCPQGVFKTPSGKKYHLGSCRMVENVSQKITLKQAGEMGLEPCKICRPASAYLLSATSQTQVEKGQSVTVQCKGITKAGTRCLHMIKIANGYCFQHNPDK